MFLIVRLQTGERVEAVVLAARGNCLRTAVKGSRDTIEFRFSGNQWFSEDGDPVEFEAVLQDGRTGVTQYRLAANAGAIAF
jgi:hypothetical protein